MASKSAFNKYNLIDLISALEGLFKKYPEEFSQVWNTWERLKGEANRAWADVKGRRASGMDPFTAKLVRLASAHPGELQDEILRVANPVMQQMIRQQLQRTPAERKKEQERYEAEEKRRKEEKAKRDQEKKEKREDTAKQRFEKYKANPGTKKTVKDFEGAKGWLNQFGKKGTMKLTALERDLVRVANDNPEVADNILDLVLKNREAAQGKGQWVAFKELPDGIQKGLKQIGYRRPDVEVIPSTTYTIGGGSPFEGNRSHTVAVNLATGQTKVETGNWGGRNPFEHKQVDWDEETRQLPPNSAVIKGESGGRGAFARVYIHPSNLAALLPSGDEEELPEIELKALNAIVGLKGGPYRSEAFARHRLGPYHPDNPVIKSLAAKGLIKVQRNGIMATPKGKTVRNNGPRVYI